MLKYKRIIFLDEENTRLSPLTAALFKRKARQAGLEDLSVLSRGTVVLFPEPVNQKIAEVAKQYEIDLSAYSARALREKDFTEETLVLTMDNASKMKAYARFASAGNVYTLKEFLGSSGDLKLPLGGTVEEYKTVMDIVSGLLDSLVKKFAASDE
ncbi:MAG: hypothetical protein IKZ95_02015 [Lachnospiraceae bacterium]|nr:hypothetical protein [Lachnospiraceae bacterium]